MLEKAEKEKLIQEMNELSSDFHNNKKRMIEIARILQADYYGYDLNPKDKKYVGEEPKEI